MCFAPEFVLDESRESEAALAFGREVLSRVPLAEAVLWVWRWKRLRMRGFCKRCLSKSGGGVMSR